MPERARTGTELGTERARKGRRTEADRTVGLRQTLPDGIALGRWSDDRNCCWFMRYGPRASRKMESFETERQRNDAAELLAEKQARHGTEIFDFDAGEWRRYKDFRSRCPAPLAELEALWGRFLALSQTQLVKDAAPRYLNLRLSEDVRKGTDTFRHIDLHLRRLVMRFGMLRLDELTADLLREALNEIVSEKTGRKLGPLARRTHRKDWNTFLKRAVTEGWADKNPCAAVIPPKVEAKKKRILTPRQMFDLFKANKHAPVIGRLALEAFGGLRASSAERMLEPHIKWKERGLELTKAEGDADDTPHKSGERKFRQGHPSTLWQWLELAPETCWTTIDRNNYGHKKGAAFVRAGVVNAGNTLRHSFISYLLVISKSYPHVGYLAQHTKASTTEGYEGIATEEDARLIFAITPAAVELSWAQFLKGWRKFYVEPVQKQIHQKHEHHCNVRH